MPTLPKTRGARFRLASPIASSTAGMAGLGAAGWFGEGWNPSTALAIARAGGIVAGVVERHRLVPRLLAAGPTRANPRSDAELVLRMNADKEVEYRGKSLDDHRLESLLKRVARRRPDTKIVVEIPRSVDEQQAISAVGATAMAQGLLFSTRPAE